MLTQIEKKCPECKIKNIVLWEQVCGIRLLTKYKDKDHFVAKCSECKHEWYVRK